MSIQEKVEKEELRQSIISYNERCNEIKHRLKVLYNDQGKAFNEFLYMIKHFPNKSWLKFQINEALFYRFTSILNEYKMLLIEIELKRLNPEIRTKIDEQYPDIKNRNRSLDIRIHKCFKLVDEIEAKILKHYKKINYLIYTHMESETCKEEPNKNNN